MQAGDMRWVAAQVGILHL